MADAEGVVVTFAALGEARDAAMRAQAGHTFAASGKNLVGVGLMADVPDQPVMRRIEDVMQGNRQFDRAEVGGQMPARA